ncbi:MAG: hypothetical protein KAR00_00865 [Candidatus Pacebacteria bacterium]|nr:hypothetical protein [Candidatus Paceibacterota bacterium]
MRNTQKGIAVPLIVIVIAVLVGGGVYMCFRLQDEKKTQEEKLQMKLSQAQTLVEEETDKLNEFKKIFRATYSQYAAVQAECIKIANIVRSLDILFDKPSTNPKIRLYTETPKIEADINGKRAEINNILKSCPNKTASAIKKDAEAVKSFVDDLLAIIDALTPENSGFSQEQIDIYFTTIFEAAGEIDAIIETLANSSANENEQITITSEEIIMQEDVVTQAQEEVETIQEELEEVQSGSSSGDTSSEESTSSSTSEESSSEESSSEDTDFTGGEIPDGGGIIIQDGPPELIQGSNPF